MKVYENAVFFIEHTERGTYIINKDNKTELVLENQHLEELIELIIKLGEEI